MAYGHSDPIELLTSKPNLLANRPGRHLEPKDRSGNSTRQSFVQ
jgi:hypothetical protein